MTTEQLVKTLRYCSAVGMCDDCWLTTIQKEFGAPFCDDKLKQEAADLIEQQDARIKELEAKAPRWIPVTERLPKKGEDGRRDSDWVHCIVSVIWTYGSNFADGDAGTHMFSAPALFDADQKIWSVGSTDESRFSVNALIPFEDSDGVYFVTHWMPYQKPQEMDGGDNDATY